MLQEIPADKDYHCTGHSRKDLELTLAKRPGTHTIKDTGVIIDAMVNDDAFEQDVMTILHQHKHTLRCLPACVFEGILATAKRLNAQTEDHRKALLEMLRYDDGEKAYLAAL